MKKFASTFAAVAAVALSSSAVAQSEPDRLLRLNSGFGDANYYFCSATSRSAPDAVQVLTEVVSTDARVTLYQMLAGVEEAADHLPGRPWRDVRCHEGSHNTFKTREAAEDYRQQWIDSSRKLGEVIVEIAWPGKLGDSGRPSRAVKSPAPSKPSTEGTATAAAGGAPGSTPAAGKYVEVTGPNGPMRLSPEVIARNQAAAEEYARKLEAYNLAKAEHDRSLKEHQQNVGEAASATQGHQEQLAGHAVEVASAKAAVDQYLAATKAPDKIAKGWMYCDARGALSDKRRFYSRISEVTYIPGEITIIDVMAKNRAAFKAYVAGAHAVAFTTDDLVHCPYSTDTSAEAESLEARDKRGDANNEIQSVQTGWTPSS